MYLPVLARAFVATAFQQPPPAPPAPPPPAAKRYDFPTKLTPGEPRLIEIRTTSNSTLHFDAGGKATDSRVRGESTTWIVDTPLDPASQPKDHVWSGRRRVVKAQETKDGVVDDPDSNGFEAAVWRDDTNHVHLESTTPRMLSQSTMDDLLGSAEAFGLGDGVELPASAVVGDAFEMPFATLAPWCLTTEGKTPKAIAHLHFDAVDAKKNVARFKGPVHVEEVLEKSAEAMDAPFGIKATGIYDGAVSIEYDVVAHRITRIVCAAKASYSGETVGSVAAKVSGTNAIETTVTCTAGAPAASALDQKTQYRDVPHAIGNAGVSLALPSHFTKYPPGVENATGFRSLLQGTEKYVRVLVLPIEDASKSVKEAGPLFRASFEKSIGAGSTTTDATVSSGLGAASAFEYIAKGEHGLCALFMVSPGLFVSAQCACPESAWTERSKEFPKYLQSLKKLPAAK